MNLFDKRLLPAFAMLLLSACGGGGGGSSSGGGGGGPPPASVTVSGRITYDRVPFEACADGTCRDGTFADGLDYVNTQEAPARAVTVELVNATNRTVLATVATDASGNYTLTAPPNTSACADVPRLQRAELGDTGDLQHGNDRGGPAAVVGAHPLR